MKALRLFYIFIFLTACTFRYDLPTIDTIGKQEPPNALITPISSTIADNTCHASLNDNVIVVPNFAAKRDRSSTTCRFILDLPLSPDLATGFNDKYIKISLSYQAKNYADTRIVSELNEWALYSDTFKIIIRTNQSSHTLAALGGYDIITGSPKEMIGYYKPDFNNNENQLISLIIDFSNLYSHSTNYDSMQFPLVPAEFFNKPTTLTINSVQIVDHP